MDSLIVFLLMFSALVNHACTLFRPALAASTTSAPYIERDGAIQAAPHYANVSGLGSRDYVDEDLNEELEEDFEEDLDDSAELFEVTIPSGPNDISKRTLTSYKDVSVTTGTPQTTNLL